MMALMAFNFVWPVWDDSARARGDHTGSNYVLQLPSLGSIQYLHISLLRVIFYSFFTLRDFVPRSSSEVEASMVHEKSVLPR